ncbi:uncharacterized protein BDW70DRAFT_165384 [Aspergillus foveolatus]|uniref:uncharacterized protein n=1 Tax=Aspergillus foveolatus TaxID=210207 RepID=UPI003CCD9EC8
MWICTSKFELEQVQLKLIKEYLPAGEVAAIQEERAPLQPQANLEPVSDDEEDDTGDIQTQIGEQTRKRQCLGTGEDIFRDEQHVQQSHEPGKEIEPPLPHTQNEIIARGTKSVTGVGSIRLRHDRG